MFCAVVASSLSVGGVLIGDGRGEKVKEEVA